MKPGKTNQDSARTALFCVSTVLLHDRGYNTLLSHWDKNHIYSHPWDNTFIHGITYSCTTPDHFFKKVVKLSKTPRKLRIPNGKHIWFCMKCRQWLTPASSESASNHKIMHIVNKAGLFHILFGLIKFYQYCGFKFKSLIKNIVVTVQVERLYETI